MFQHQVEQKRTTCIEIAGWVYFWSCGAFFAWGKVSSLSANPFLMPAFYSYSTCLVCMPLPSSKGCKMLRVVNSAAPTTCHAGEPRCSCPLPFTFAEATEGWRLLLELGWCWQRLTELSYMYMIIYIYLCGIQISSMIRPMWMQWCNGCDFPDAMLQCLSHTLAATRWILQRWRRLFVDGVVWGQICGNPCECCRAAKWGHWSCVPGRVE